MFKEEGDRIEHKQIRKALPSSEASKTVVANSINDVAASTIRVQYANMCAAACTRMFASDSGPHVLLIIARNRIQAYAASMMPIGIIRPVVIFDRIAFGAKSAVARDGRVDRRRLGAGAGIVAHI